MRPALVLFLLAIFLSTSMFAQPANLSVEHSQWSNYWLCSKTPNLPLCPPQDTWQDGVWVSVWVSDQTTRALAVSLDYTDSLGRRIIRTQQTVRWYPDRAAWTGLLFAVGKVTVNNVLPVALTTKSTEMAVRATIQEKGILVTGQYQDNETEGLFVEIQASGRQAAYVISRVFKDPLSGVADGVSEVIPWNGPPVENISIFRLVPGTGNQRRLLQSQDDDGRIGRKWGRLQ